MPSFQDYHYQLGVFCRSLEPIPTPVEETPATLLVRAQALLEGYQMALMDLHAMWSQCAVWITETPRPEFAQRLQTLEDLLAQRLGLVPAGVAGVSLSGGMSAGEGANTPPFPAPSAAPPVDPGIAGQPPPREASG